MNGNIQDPKQRRQITEYNRKKMSEIFGVNMKDCFLENPYYDIHELCREHNVLIKKWYDIEVIKSIPFQDITILPKVTYNYKDFIPVDKENIITTGIGFAYNYINRFVQDSNPDLGIGQDKNGDYYQIISVKKRFALVDLDFSNLKINVKMLNMYFKVEEFIKQYNPELLQELDEVVERTGEESNETINKLIDVWKYLDETNDLSKLYISTAFACPYDDQNTINDPAFKTIKVLANRKEKIKKIPVTLYSQIFRPVKKKENSNTVQVNINNEEYKTKSSQDSFKINCCEALFLIIAMIINICGILGTLASEDIGSGLKIIYIGIMIISCVAAFVNGYKKNNLTGTIFGTNCVLGVLNSIWIYWLLNCQ